MVSELLRGWRPFSDDAAIASRAYESLSLHPPLIGRISSAYIGTGHLLFDPGPLLFYVLAVPVHLDPSHGLFWGLVLVAAAVLSISIEAGVVGQSVGGRCRGGVRGSRPFVADARSIRESALERLLSSTLLHCGAGAGLGGGAGQGRLVAGIGLRGVCRRPEPPDLCHPSYRVDLGGSCPRPDERPPPPAPSMDLRWVGCRPCVLASAVDPGTGRTRQPIRPGSCRQWAAHLRVRSRIAAGR